MPMITNTITDENRHWIVQALVIYAADELADTELQQKILELATVFRSLTGSLQITGLEKRGTRTQNGRAQ